VVFPDPRDLGDHDVVAVGTDFSPGTLLEAYRHGIFPWPHGNMVAWFSPHPRAIFPLDAAPRWSRSLRRTLRNTRLRVTVDRAFLDVIRACGDERPEGTWIRPDLVAGYARLHHMGWAHSLEVWDGDALVGGIYGVAIGRVFAGESMFHRKTDASKIAFAKLVERLRAAEFALFDVQVMNPHLESLGCVEIARDDYLARLEGAVLAAPRALDEARGER